MPRILLVEDSAVQSRAIGNLLESGSHQVDYASNGRLALEYLAVVHPDLIVTDLEMPEVDGLTLVREVHVRGLKVPIVLMTAHGSEQIAVEALRTGASSYVPKALLNEMLLDTVDGIVSVSSEESSYERLIACATKTEFEFELDNDPELISPLVDLLQQMIENICNLSMGERVRVGSALEQALHNAIFRGNLEIPGPGTVGHAVAATYDVSQRKAEQPYAARRAHMRATISPDQIQFDIKDEGPGFDVARLRNEDAAANLIDARGRGLVLMQAFMDEVTFSDRGNEVMLLKYCGAAPPTPAAQPAATAATPATSTRDAHRPFARLIAVEGGHQTPLTTRRIIIGRDRSCDVVLSFPDVSSHHCQLFLYSGWWYVKDLHTKNGIRVNGAQAAKRRLNPGDVLSVAKHKFEIQYDPGDLGAVGPTPPPDPF